MTYRYKRHGEHWKISLFSERHKVTRARCWCCGKCVCAVCTDHEPFFMSRDSHV